MSILYIVSTPIGNLEDVTRRALRILKEVDFILCEDTRQTLKLLNHYNIQKPLVSYFQHSKLAKIDYIIGQLRQGKKIALVTNAGTPGISDPGGKLISKILESAQVGPVQIVSVPGPSALTAAASISGFPMDRFLFLGFPPAKRKRKKFFEEIINSKYPVIFYESPYRIIKSLRDLRETDAKFTPTPKFGVGAGAKQSRNVVICREMTKKFETIYRGNLGEMVKILENDKNNLKGEFVVIVSKQKSP